MNKGEATRLVAGMAAKDEYVDAGLWSIVSSGGVSGALFIFCLYLATQNRDLAKRNQALADREADRAVAFATTILELQKAIEKLSDRLRRD